MADVFKMPKLGESVTTGTVTRWLVAAGDTVDFDDPLLEVSTDKVDSEIPSPFSGVLLEIMVPEGETVDVGADLARIGEPGAEAPSAQAPSRPQLPLRPRLSFRLRLWLLFRLPFPPRPRPGAAAGRCCRRSSGSSPLSTASTSARSRDRAPPAGSCARTSRPPSPAWPRPHPRPRPRLPPWSRPRRSPPRPRRPPLQPAPAAAAAKLGPRDEAQPLSRMRLAIGERMISSLRVAPHVWTSVEVDLQAVEDVRRRHKERFRREEGMSLTYLSFIARATCDALRSFPVVNSSVDMQAKTRVLHHYVNLGIAVDLNEQGLVAPVVKDADGLNLRGLARAIRAAADKVNGGKFTNDDLAGSTFTITNPGPFGDYASAPIINQPNAAIMSTNMVSRRPTAVGDAVAVHYMTILGFCYDHRAFDGVTASRFLAYIRDALQDRDWEAELG